MLKLCSHTVYDSSICLISFSDSSLISYFLRNGRRLLRRLAVPVFAEIVSDQRT